MRSQPLGPGGDGIEPRTRGGRYLEMSRDYIAAVQRLAAQSPGTAGEHAFWALASHGLELTLKAFLRAQGCDEERLMMINHSLELSLNTCRRLGMDDWDGDLLTLVEALDRPHATQSFRYPGWRVDFDALPSPEQAARTLVAHLDQMAETLNLDAGPSAKRTTDRYDPNG